MLNPCGKGPATQKRVPLRRTASCLGGMPNRSCGEPAVDLPIGLTAATRAKSSTTVVRPGIATATPSSSPQPGVLAEISVNPERTPGNSNPAAVILGQSSSSGLAGELLAT